MEVTIESSIVMFSYDFAVFGAHVWTNQRQQLLRSERWLEFALRGGQLSESLRTTMIRFAPTFAAVHGNRPVVSQGPLELTAERGSNPVTAMLQQADEFRIV
ncbi:MAG: hypothetical protein ABGZ53_35700 [Fuerstiella sp.]